MTDKSCSQEDIELLLTAHGALPWPEQLKVQLHRLRCPNCRKRYQELSQTSQALSASLSVRGASQPRATPRSLPLWGAALVCLLALSAVTWAARSYFGPPPTAECSITEEELPKGKNCLTPSSARHQKE
jgi:anti-sigma factor ChrR (cupin superfamily)